MAEERSLGLARASDHSTEDLSKMELQRRMDEARDSITQTVTEIKDTVVHQYESVKETINDSLDWREQFKKRPVVYSAGALGGGFVVGYTIAAIVKGNSNGDHARFAPVESPVHVAAATYAESKRQKRTGPSLLERFQQTDAYDHLRNEAASVGSKFVGDLSQKAQQVVIPAAISWLTQWLTQFVPESAGGQNTPKRVGNEH